MAVNRGLIARASGLVARARPDRRHWKDINSYKEPVPRYATRKASALRDTTPGTEPWLGLNIPVKEKLRMAISEYFA